MAHPGSAAGNRSAHRLPQTSTTPKRRPPAHARTPLTSPVYDTRWRTMSPPRDHTSPDKCRRRRRHAPTPDTATTRPDPRAGDPDAPGAWPMAHYLADPTTEAEIQALDLCFGGGVGEVAGHGQRAGGVGMPRGVAVLGGVVLPGVVGVVGRVCARVGRAGGGRCWPAGAWWVRAGAWAHGPPQKGVQVGAGPARAWQQPRSGPTRRSPGK